ncbi:MULTISPECIES: MJ0042-type zinc finger domain-containing protein [unclassified Bradyrhizobium]|uniref:MJ0042-type zinc finger domain-containing protein n=1 Tax=unclassified Bradyrhizobium TaxID=2631580 RepID=UPI0024799D4E|nr:MULTISPECIES: MJ0042-type zinc finger domain-containing protein [unclassified Bradyrhizobium]WGR72258.1 zinc-ribbon domain-containing protein [Bradyrhizobium sp. ISRA426]WGR77092.1 zinc-ribbon domain-containing protein [Bradyrhizobium sp. ISRA430]WGR87497.1 zinc-ribbon domain-containing protein [Bradyrhizobium sp. ISRA432]
MHIVCPHCTTSYAIKLASLGANGRTVRCSRCKETWVAHPEDAIEEASVPTMVAASRADDQSDLAEQWNSYARDDGAADTPVVDSPSIASDWPDENAGQTEDDWSAAGSAEDDGAGVQHQSWFRGLFRRRMALASRTEAAPARRKSYPGLPTACAAMGALVAALVIWRTDMVRLLPQTAAFYRMVGFDVNLRGLAFKDVKLSSETVDRKQVLVIEGVIVGEGNKKPLEIPRLRFAVRDAQGAEIYAWNAVLEQTVLRPGERAFFRSRLASPPAEGRNIDVRFFNRRDVVGGSV